MSNLSPVRFLTLLTTVSLFTAPALARHGVVSTLQGDTFSGHVRFTPERIVIVNSALGLLHQVTLTNVARISFPTNSVVAVPEEFADASLPPTWSEADIGAAFISGSTRREGSTYSVRSAGVNIDGDADSFHFVFKPVRGDSEIVAEVVSIQYTHPDAKGGLMMRETLNEYSPNVMVALTAERGAAFQFRGQERAQTDVSATRRVFAPHWVKLRRRGDEFTAFVSPNGRVWSLLDKISLPMNQAFYVGLAVTSAREAMLNWTTFAKVREAPRLMNDRFVPEVELVSGSIVTGRPERADEREVSFAGVPKVLRVPTERVARISYQPLTGEVAWKTRVSRPGVWVSTGDFFDGDFRGIDGRQLTISSVLYGLRTFDIDDEVLAVVLQPRQPGRAAFELETPDGAMLYLSEVSLGTDELRVTESAVGEIRVPAFEILELRRR